MNTQELKNLLTEAQSHVDKNRVHPRTAVLLSRRVCRVSDPNTELYDVALNVHHNAVRFNMPGLEAGYKLLIEQLKRAVSPETPTPTPKQRRSRKKAG